MDDVESSQEAGGRRQNNCCALGLLPPRNSTRPVTSRQIQKRNGGALTPPFDELLSQAKLLDQALVAALIILGEIAEQAIALSDHLQQTAAAAEVVLVIFQVT